MLCPAVGVVVLAALAVIGFFCMRRRRMIHSRYSTDRSTGVADPENKPPAAARSNNSVDQQPPEGDRWPGAATALKGPLLSKEGSGATAMTSTGTKAEFGK